MEIVLPALLALFLVAFGIGYAVLKIGGGVHRGAGSGGRIIVGVLFVICVVLTFREFAAVEHPHSFEMYSGLIDFLFAIIIGTAGLGLLAAFLLSFRSPPIDRSSLPPIDTTSFAGTKEKGPPQFSWRGPDRKQK